jgi:hypothetical protein
MTLFATHGGSGAADTNLYTVNTGDMSLTTIGDTGKFFTGLAFDPTDLTKLYGVTGNVGSNQRTLFLLDPATGSATLIAVLGVTIPDITFDASGQLYGMKISTKRLVTINKSTGTIVEVGPSGLSFTPSGSGLAIDPSNDNLVWLFPSGGAGDVYHINKTTGVATFVGILSPTVAASSYISAASFGPSNVLYCIGNDIPGPLFTIGPPVGVTFDEYPETLVGEMPHDEPWDAIAWSSSEPDVPPDLATLPGKYAVYHNGQWHIMRSDILT